jgi:predicted tellurium resistance membrane protein TerC
METAFADLALIVLIDTFSKRAQNANIDSPTRLIHAIKIIIIADFSMSLDNILAISGASHGEIRLVIFGLLLSVPILMFFSQKIAGFMDKYPLLVYVGAIILSMVAAELICSDRIVGQYISKPLEIIITIAIVVSVFVISKIKFYLIRIR